MRGQWFYSTSHNSRELSICGFLYFKARPESGVSVLCSNDETAISFNLPQEGSQQPASKPTIIQMELDCEGKQGNFRTTKGIPQTRNLAEDNPKACPRAAERRYDWSSPWAGYRSLFAWRVRSQMHRLFGSGPARDAEARTGPSGVIAAPPASRFASALADKGLVWAIVAHSCSPRRRRLIEFTRLIIGEVGTRKRRRERD